MARVTIVDPGFSGLAAATEASAPPPLTQEQLNAKLHAFWNRDVVGGRCDSKLWARTPLDAVKKLRQVQRVVERALAPLMPEIRAHHDYKESGGLEIPAAIAKEVSRSGNCDMASFLSECEAVAREKLAKELDRRAS